VIKEDAKTTPSRSEFLPPLEAPHIPHEEVLLCPILGKYLLKPAPDGLYGLGVSFGLWGNEVLGVVDPLMLHM